MLMGVVAIISLSFLIFMVAVVLSSFGKMAEGGEHAVNNSIQAARTSYKFRQAFRTSARPLPRVLGSVVML